MVQRNGLGMGRMMSLFRILGWCQDMSERRRYFSFFNFLNLIKLDISDIILSDCNEYSVCCL